MSEKLQVKRLLDRSAVEQAQFDLITLNLGEMLRLMENEALKLHLVLPREVQVQMNWFMLDPDKDDETMWINVGQDELWTQIELTATAICQFDEDAAIDG